MGTEAFVVNGTHIVYAADSTSAIVRYQLYVKHVTYPTVRHAEQTDFATLPILNRAA
jgi:hypothetical protein